MTQMETLCREDQVAAQEAKIGRPCVSCGKFMFHRPHGFAVCEGHVYSQAGLIDALKIIQMCEFCFDAMESDEERDERNGVVRDPEVPHELPLEGQTLQTVDLMNDNYGGASGRYETSDPERAYVITSLVDESNPKMHRPVLDIDFPARLIPSSTEGHFHLYLDVEIPHEKYMALLDSLADCGIIEPGYASASKDRGYTVARLPWIKKPPQTRWRNSEGEARMNHYSEDTGSYGLGCGYEQSARLRFFYVRILRWHHEWSWPRG